MGFSCTQAALRTLQAIKEVKGADLASSNEIRLDNGALAFFERQDEREGGGITGEVYLLNGMRLGLFAITGDGKITAFRGIGKRSIKAIEAIAADPSFRSTVAVV